MLLKAQRRERVRRKKVSKEFGNSVSLHRTYDQSLLETSCERKDIQLKQLSVVQASYFGRRCLTESPSANGESGSGYFSGSAHCHGLASFSSSVSLFKVGRAEEDFAVVRWHHALQSVPE